MVGYKGPDGKRAIVKLLVDEIDGDPLLRAWVEKLELGNFFRFLTNLVDQQPDVYVIMRRVPRSRRLVRGSLRSRGSSSLRSLRGSM